MKKTAEFFEFIADMDSELVHDIRLMHDDGRTPPEIAGELMTDGVIPAAFKEMLIGFVFGVIVTIDGIDK